MEEVIVARLGKILGIGPPTTNQVVNKWKKQGQMLSSVARFRLNTSTILG
jgi:hypothetical protein